MRTPDLMEGGEIEAMVDSVEEDKGALEAVQEEDSADLGRTTATSLLEEITYLQQTFITEVIPRLIIHQFSSLSF